MSDTLHKIMTLNDLQKRQAQAAAMGQMSAAMGNPNVRGSGIDRMLAALVAGSQPAMQAYDESAALSQAQNAQAYKMQQRDAEMQRKVQLDAMREQRLNDQMADNRAYKREYLRVLRGKNEAKSRKEQAELEKQNVQMPDGMVGRPYGSMTKHEQNFATKDMAKNLEKAEALSDVYGLAKNAKKILADNPKLNEYWSIAMMDPNKTGTLIETIKRDLLMPEKERQAAEKFFKDTATLVALSAQTYGGRGSDQLRKLIEQGKARFGNTLQANMYVLDEIIDRSAEGPAWSEALRDGLTQGVYVMKDPKRYRKMTKESEIVPPTPEDGAQQEGSMNFTDASTEALLKRRQELLGK